VRTLQGLAHGRQHGLDRFLALGEVAQRHLLLLAERLPGQLQEHFAVAAQRLARDRVETSAQPLHRELERLLALSADFLRGSYVGTCRGQFDLEFVGAPPPDEPPDGERSDRQQREQQQRFCGKVAHDAIPPGALSAGPPAPTHASNCSGRSTIPVAFQHAGESSSLR
jgi:hypothetical protein